MSGSNLWLMALTLLAGALVPLQAGINGQLARQVPGALSAALISFLVGSCALLALVLSQRGLPSVTELRGLHWWHWCGGLLGAFFIAHTAFAGPRLGATLFMGLILAGQLSMALLLDHQGWAGFRETTISPARIGGLGLVFAGVWLIQRG